MAFVVSGRRSQELASSAINPPMRGVVDGLASPRPIAALLPAAFQEDDFCLRMMSAFDEVLAPFFLTLDCFDTYLDPELAPEDFVEWLAGWVGVDIDETWSTERRRRLIQDAVGLYRTRGTAAGLVEHIKLYCGVTPEIDESGACAWSQTADSAMPGSPQPHLTVRLRVDDDEAVKRTTVSRIVGGSRPAHLPYSVEIYVGGAAQGGADAEEAGGQAAGDAPGAVALPGSESIELAPQAPPSQEDLDEPSASASDENEPPS